jgi:hypothetical protein
MCQCQPCCLPVEEQKCQQSEPQFICQPTLRRSYYRAARYRDDDPYCENRGGRDYLHEKYKMRALLNSGHKNKRFILFYYCAYSTKWFNWLLLLF